MQKRLRAAAFLTALTAAVSSVAAQSPAKRFEVVSIKRNRTVEAASDTNTTPGRLSLVNVTMLSVVLRAFGVLNPQVVGAPGWSTSERYDILAVTGDGAALTDENRRAYLQHLLVERCEFAFHRETREIRVYSLVPSKDGPKVVAHAGPGEYSMRVQPTEDGRRRLRSTRGDMARLVEILTGVLGELVIDRTGLSGGYDFTLEWAPNANESAAGASLFTAIVEQLGLRLESGNQPMEAIVIDRIERPTED
ncbi:MAG TPA: TIGR03435 family protein [Vicinamibacterales bacterium]|nr:TIGR03435 family protein [Vicinamibacterales bacterium]